jgi:tricorn protease
MQPCLRGDVVVFVSAGDLWHLELGRAVPRRLTNFAGSVSRPKISPDGKLIAFAARHDGPAALHVMPASGGAARRLVYHPAPCEPVGFTPDSRRVLFVSTLGSTHPRTVHLFSVAVEGGDVRREPYGPATTVAFSADGRHIVLGRGYQDPAAWKRYAGGLAGTLWAGTREPLELRRITPGPRGESQPAFWGERVVFLTDADGSGNLWSCRIDGTDRRQHTHHDRYYVRWPSVDAGRVVYQQAGDLHQLDLATGDARRLDIDLRADMASTRRRYVDATRWLEAAQPSPDGSHVLVTARGRVSSLPAWRGPTKVVGDAEGVRFAHAAWMPDGKSVVVVHDAAGEEEIEIRPLAGKGEVRRFGRAGEGRLRKLLPSPDGKWLAMSEQASGLQLIEVQGGARRPVDRADSGAILEMSWSPDGAWLAYARPRRYRASIHLHEVATGRTVQLTTREFDDGDPCFDPSGRYLYFLSRRIYNPYADELQHDVAFPATTQPYCVVLGRDRPSPFAPLPASELGMDTKPAEGGDAADAGRKNGEKAPEPPAVRIDLDGLSDRVVEIPVREGRYAGILATKDKVFFLRRPLLGMFGTSGEEAEGGDDGRLAKLIAFDLASREEKVHATGVKEASLSHDGKMALLRGENALRLVATPKPPQNTEIAAGKPGEATGVVDLSRVRVRVDPEAEWRQIFREAWRQQRGHFWTETMSRVDWNAMWGRYEPLVRRVRTRDELSDILWDLQGELGTSHAYVIGGDEPPRPNYRVSLLGADLELDPASGRYRVTAIHAGDTWAPGAHSPLVEPGVNVSVGDHVLAIDGREAGRDAHPWELLERAGPAVTLTVSRTADGAGARDVVVAPLQSEHRCRYREWVKRNQRVVDDRTGGRVGYVHVPDMMVQGLVEFHRGFLWQSDREGLIVDVRDNGGGNVSQILLEKLRRQLIGYCKARWAEGEPVPDNVMTGPMVALCNELTGSDGDIFCQSWKQLALGPLIGKRTWGGVVGIDRSKTLVDGGQITQPEYAFWFVDRGWDVEGTGVEPDIEVDITPMDHAAGRDPQLERAIDEVLALMSKRPGGPPRLPPPPDRSRR